MSRNRALLLLSGTLALLVGCGEDSSDGGSGGSGGAAGSGAAGGGGIAGGGGAAGNGAAGGGGAAGSGATNSGGAGSGGAAGSGGSAPGTQCSAGCPAGQTCDTVSGWCVTDLDVPPPAPSASCSAGVGTVPDWQCSSGCAEIIPFEPVTGPGYDNYPINGETAADQTWSYLRRDVTLLIKYAAAMVDCQTAAWSYGNGGALGLGNMSEKDGSRPGTSQGNPMAAPGTYENGTDIDVAYFQVGTADNRLRIVCDHMQGGTDAYMCTSAPSVVDHWRTALFLGHLRVFSKIRTILVDGKIGPDLETATTKLCGLGYLDSTVCAATSKMEYGVPYDKFFYHHVFISTNP